VLENNIKMEDWKSSVIFYRTKNNEIFSSVSYNIFSEGLSQEEMRIVSGKEKYIQILMGISEVKRLFSRYRFKREYNIKIYIRELGCKGVGWIRMIQDRIKQ